MKKLTIVFIIIMILAVAFGIFFFKNIFSFQPVQEKESNNYGTTSETNLNQNNSLPVIKTNLATSSGGSGQKPTDINN